MEFYYGNCKQSVKHSFRNDISKTEVSRTWYQVPFLILFNIVYMLFETYRGLCQEIIPYKTQFEQIKEYIE